MGLNRIYTFGGSPLKNAAGNPIGFEHIPVPSDYVELWNFESNTTGTLLNGTAITITGTSAIVNSDSKKIGSNGLSLVPSATGKGTHIKWPYAVYGSYLKARNVYTVVVWAKIVNFNPLGENSEQQHIINTAEYYKGSAHDYISVGNTINANKIMVSREDAGDTPVVSTDTIDPLVWNLYALQYDGNNVNAFVNGVLMATKASTFSIPNGYSELTIGSETYGGNLSDRGSGYYDQMRLFNYALTSSQITAIYNAEK